LNATSSVPSPSKCTKIVGGWGFVPDLTGEFTVLCRPIAGLKGLLLREKRRGGEGRKGLWTITMLETD